MTESQINCFMAVAKYKSFSKAASILYISQPAISKQVAQLEKSVGYPLVDRSFKTFHLTQAGELFCEFFQNATERYHKLLETLEQISLGHAGNLRLGCLDGWDLSFFLPKLSSALAGKYPDIHLYLSGYNHIDILGALEQNEIDMALTLSTCIPEQTVFARREITRVRAMLITSVSHPSAQKEEMSLPDFKDDPFFVIAPETGVGGSLEQATRELCQEVGFTPDIVRMPSSASIQTRLQGGRGARIASEWERTGNPDLFRFVPLDRELSVCAVWIENAQSPMKHILLDELCAM